MNKVQDSCTGLRFPRIPRFWGTIRQDPGKVPKNLGNLGNLGPVQVLWRSYVKLCCLFEKMHFPCVFWWWTSELVQRVFIFWWNFWKWRTGFWFCIIGCFLRQMIAIEIILHTVYSKNTGIYSGFCMCHKLKDEDENTYVIHPLLQVGPGRGWPNISIHYRLLNSTKMSSGWIFQCPGFCAIAKSAPRAMYWPKRELPSGCCLQCWAGTWTTHQHHSSNYLLGMPKQHENQQKVCPNVRSYIWRYTLFEDMLQIDVVLIQLPTTGIQSGWSHVITHVFLCSRCRLQQTNHPSNLYQRPANEKVSQQIAISCNIHHFLVTWPGWLTFASFSTWPPRESTF